MLLVYFNHTLYNTDLNRKKDPFNQTRHSQFPLSAQHNTHTTFTYALTYTRTHIHAYAHTQMFTRTHTPTHLHHTTIVKSAERRGRVSVRWIPATHALLQLLPTLTHPWYLGVGHVVIGSPNLVCVLERGVESVGKGC